MMEQAEALFRAAWVARGNKLKVSKNGPASNWGRGADDCCGVGTPFYSGHDDVRRDHFVVVAAALRQLRRRKAHLRTDPYRENDGQRSGDADRHRRLPA